jgi:hypothetical protein
MKAPKKRSWEPVRRGRGMTAQEAAAYLSVKISTLAKWRKKGKGPRFSDALDRSPRYHQDDLDNFLWGDGLVGNSVEATERRARRRRPNLDREA